MLKRGECHAYPKGPSIQSRIGNAAAPPKKDPRLDDEKKGDRKIKLSGNQGKETKDSAGLPKGNQYIVSEKGGGNLLSSARVCTWALEGAGPGRGYGRAGSLKKGGTVTVLRGEKRRGGSWLISPYHTLTRRRKRGRALALC